MNEILIENNQNKLELTEEIISACKAVCGEALSSEECNFDAEVSITFVDNEEIHALNNEHRGIDRPTDVLSFPILEFDEEGNILEEFIEEDLDNGCIILGDIIISLERANEQAEEFGHSLLREVSFLTAHSMLHLLGYDHVDSEEDERIMRTKQTAILDKLNIKR